MKGNGLRTRIRRFCLLGILGASVAAALYSRSHLGIHPPLRRKLAVIDPPCEGGGGALFACGLGVIFCCIGLAVLNDQFFEPSLKLICESLHLSDDVASATFFAAGSSAPALILNFLGTFTGSSVGVSAIVGSNICNLLGVIGVGGFWSIWTPGKSFSIDWRPFLRDMAFYVLSLIQMQIFFNDGIIEIWEAVIMVFSYILYVIFMCYNKRLLAMLPGSKDDEKNPARASSSEKDQDQAEEGRSASSSQEIIPTSDGHQKNAPTSDDNPIVLDSFTISQSPVVNGETLEMTSQRRSSEPCTSPKMFNEVDLTLTQSRRFSAEVPRNYSCPLPETVRRQSNRMSDASHYSQHHPAGHLVATHGHRRTLTKFELTFPLLSPEEEEGRFTWPKERYDQAWFLLELPFRAFMHISIPDVTVDRFQDWYWFSFFMCTIWVTILVYYLLAFCNAFACILQINMTIMGLVPISLGATVPTFLLALWGARAGSGDYVVMQPLGSNVWNCFACLGLPWLIWLAVYYPEPVKVDNSLGNLIQGFLWMHMVNLIITSYFILDRFRLRLVGGIILVGTYVAFILYVILAWTSVAKYNG